MKVIRTILAIAAFSILAACGKSDATRITDVLKQCAQVSQKASSIPMSPVEKANYVAAAFQKMDVTRCPAEFRVAFQAHVNAWSQAAPYIANDNMATSLLEGATAGVTEDPRFIGQASQQAAEAGQRINQTYFDLTEIAARYGARIPRSVVE